MFGDSEPPEIVLLADDGAGRIAEFVQTLRRLPATPPWIVVGGLAVNVRVRRAHRATNDIDTVTPDQDGLVEILKSYDDTDPISAAKIQFHNPEVEVDIMASTEGRELPTDERERAFALARRFAMRSASTVTIGAVDARGCVIERADVEVAPRAALIILKTLSFPERIDGNYRAKIGSDVQDLYRLVEREDLDILATSVIECGPELTEFIADELCHYFSAGTSNLRYTHTRMRSFTRNVDSMAITEDALAVLGVLGEIIKGRAEN